MTDPTQPPSASITHRLQLAWRIVRNQPTAYRVWTEPSGALKINAEGYQCKISHSLFQGNGPHYSGQFGAIAKVGR